MTYQDALSFSILWNGKIQLLAKREYIVAEKEHSYSIPEIRMGEIEEVLYREDKQIRNPERKRKGKREYGY